MVHPKVEETLDKVDGFMAKYPSITHCSRFYPLKDSIPSINLTMVHPKVEETLDKVDGFMAKYPSITQYERLQELEDKTGQSKVFFFLAGCTLATGILYLTGGSKLLTDLVSFVYPAYMSFKALDSATDTDDKQW
eukprot:CAMPEP_0195260196 /NCGR_PEP_ID=MMETSP0706-20130129/8435_1 /TAXON_ID=33640 /ORGANISM="Asterionellopsis glacialis, Strain CCMP134" /LENGTH=134 /DNA_ID=CAMNT_0040313879 /DNA_START=75 /DNA_END=476 /DNA_ORIENTATION=+